MIQKVQGKNKNLKFNKMVMRSLNITLHINILEFKCKNKYKLKILISLKMKFKRRYIASTNN